MPKPAMTPAEAARLGGLARAAKLSAEQRSALSRRAALALREKVPPEQLRAWSARGYAAMREKVSPEQLRAWRSSGGTATAKVRAKIAVAPRKKRATYPPGTPCSNAPACRGEASLKGMCSACYFRLRDWKRKCAAAGVVPE